MKVVYNIRRRRLVVGDVVEKIKLEESKIITNGVVEKMNLDEGQ